MWLYVERFFLVPLSDKNGLSENRQVVAQAKLRGGTPCCIFFLKAMFPKQNKIRFEFKQSVKRHTNLPCQKIVNGRTPKTLPVGVARPDSAFHV